MLNLRKCREYGLTVQSPQEAARVAMIGEQLRLLRRRVGCSRSQLAHLLRLDLELVVAVENGMGSLDAARDLLHAAQNTIDQ